MHLPPEQAFWVFVQINEEYVKGYFSDGLMAVKEDALATELLIQKLSSRGHRLLVSIYFVSEIKVIQSEFWKINLRQVFLTQLLSDGYFQY
jgi:hypothetical protein